MTAPLVDCTVDDGIATLTLNRPEKLNALTPATFDELHGHLEALALHAEVRVLVLRGAGRSFCAGHDLSGIDATATPGAAHERRAAETIDLLEAFPHPTIARIQGHCLTGGLELALGCDLLIAAESATLADTHGAWGLVPVWGMSVRLPERIGFGAAKELMFTSRRISGRVAAELGLVDRCVTDDHLDNAVLELAEEIRANSAGTNTAYKSTLAAQRGMTRTDALLYERQMPFGRPADAAERLNRSAPAPQKSAAKNSKR
jgi:enoyl-CoA hydratase/carnithine racemase